MTKNNPNWQYRYPCESFLVRIFEEFYKNQNKENCNHEVVIIKHPTQYSGFQYAQRCKKCWKWLDWHDDSNIDDIIRDNKNRKSHRYYFDSYEGFLSYCINYLWGGDDLRQWWNDSTKIMVRGHGYFRDTEYYTKEILLKMQDLTLVRRWIT
tara:strand:- start:44 stop:499 length:456 start_codon:yes stop_codon:yes gene_type:complete